MIRSRLQSYTLLVVICLALVFCITADAQTLTTTEALSAELVELEARTTTLNEDIARANADPQTDSGALAALRAGAVTIQSRVTEIMESLKIPVTPSVCTYTYSVFGQCQSNDTQARIVTASTPNGCTGTPNLSQPCKAPAGQPVVSGVQSPVLSENTSLTVYRSNNGSGVDTTVGGGGTKSRVCTPSTQETKTVPCPSGQEGEKVQRKICDSSGLGWGDWETTTTNTCHAVESQGSNPGAGHDNGSVLDNGGNGNAPTTQSDTGLTISGFLARLSGVLDSIIPFIIGLAVFIIIWGIFRYITEAANEEKRAEARQFIVWGTIGVFMMISIWGFVTVLVNTFAVDKAIQEKDIPMVPKIESKLQLYNDPYLK